MDLSAQSTAVVIDSTADFPEGPRRLANWRIVPLYVRLGGRVYRDHVDLSGEELYRWLRQGGEPPTTAQPTPADFLEVYQGLTGFARVYSLHLSATFSGTYESARAAAAELEEGWVRVVDTGSVSAGVALLGLAVQRRLERGTTEEEIEALVARFRRDVRLVFTVDTLEYLARGGRIGRASAWAGELLRVKPVLAIAEGEIVPLARVRGNRRALAELERALGEGSRDEPGLRIGIVHADAPEREQAVAEMVARTRPSARIEVRSLLGPVVGTHAGPGTVGLFWWLDRD
ncbi:MAG: DegV family protein [Thermoleophilia bacterium]